jgi:hypothetical protein
MVMPFSPEESRLPELTSEVLYQLSYVGEA